jgi:hypothetical protein
VWRLISHFQNYFFTALGDPMPASPNDILDLGCDFPWSSTSFSDLQRYVSAVHEFLPHSSAQKYVRLQARIKATTDPVEIGEFEGEMEEVEQYAATALPRIVWGGVLVAAYGALEFEIKSSLVHWSQFVSYRPAFRKKSNESFLDSAEKYSREHLQFELFPSQIYRDKLSDLNTLRNSFAHGGGLLGDLPDKLASAILIKAHNGVAFDISDGQWLPNEDSARHYLDLAKNTLKYFDNAVFDKCVAHHYGDIKS